MKTFLCVFLCALLLTGCTPYRLDEQGFVVCLGIDITKEGKIAVTVQLPNGAADNSTKADNKSEFSVGGYLLYRAEGDDFVSAMATLRSSTPQALNFSQLRQIAIGKPLAQQESFGELLTRLDQLPQARAQAHLIIIEGEALSFFQKQAPVIGERLSKYLDTVFKTQAQFGAIPDTSFFDAVRGTGYGYQNVLLPYGAKMEEGNAGGSGDSGGQKGGSEEEKPVFSQSGQALDQAAGNATHQGAAQVEYLGAAMTDGQKMTGLMTGFETQLAMLAMGHSPELVMKVDGVSMTLRNKKSPAADVCIRDGITYLVLQMNVLAVLPAASNANENDIAKSLTNAYTALLQKMQQAGCDALGFGRYALADFSTLEEWQAFDWASQYKSAFPWITVKATCTREDD